MPRNGTVTEIEAVPKGPGQYEYSAPCFNPTAEVIKSADVSKECDVNFNGFEEDQIELKKRTLKSKLEKVVSLLTVQKKNENIDCTKMNKKSNSHKNDDQLPKNK